MYGMSHRSNTIYLEQIRERFDENKDGFSRLAILAEMRGRGFESQANSLEQIWRDEREEFLESVDVSEEDVLTDEEGHEFYMDVRDSGTPGDDYQVDKIKVKVPMYLNVDHWLKTL